RDLGFFELAFTRVGQQIKRVTRPHNAGTSQRKRHARRVNRDPAAAPLLGDGGGGAGTAGRVEHEVAGGGGHQDAAFNYPWCGLDYIFAVWRSADVCPNVVEPVNGKVGELSFVTN